MRALLLAPLFGAPAAAADLGSVALLQDTLRVNRASTPASSEWWVFGRHRRAREQHDEVEPFTSMPLRSYGEAEASEAEASPMQAPSPWEAGAVLAETQPAVSMPAEARKKPEEGTEERPPSKERGAEEASAPERVQPSLYKVGDGIQAFDATNSRPGSASWVDCSVTGLGSTPGTFNIFVPEAPEGQQDYSDVPAKFLRRRPRLSYRYKAGDVMRVRISGGDKDGAWVHCKITSKAKEEDTYRVHIPLAPPGQQDLDAIPASALRPGDAYEYAALEKMLSSHPDYVERVAALQSAAAEYADGESAEVQIGSGPDKGQWAPCTILGKGSQEYTYRIAAGGQEFDHVHVVALRKAQAAKQGDAEAPPQPAADPAPAELETAAAPPAEEPPEFNVGDVGEVLVKSGPNAGSWIKVSITGKGKKPRSYDIDTGFEEFKNVPAASLRRGDAPSSWDV